MQVEGNGMSGWGVVIEGHQFDLLDWEEEMKAPFDPWVEKHGANFVLRTKVFDALQSTQEVCDYAPQLVERLNGAMLLSRKSHPVKFEGRVVEFGDGDSIRTHYVMAVGTGRFRSRGSAVALVHSGGQTRMPEPSATQKWLELAEKHDLLADALVYLSRGEWFDVYKAIESLDAFCGGDLEKKGWITDLKKVKRMANAHRHFTKGVHTPPDPPVELSEAIKKVATMIRKAFEEAGAH